MTLPPRATDVLVRVVATNDVLGTVIPLTTSAGSTGTVDGVATLLAEAQADGPAVWLDSGDFTGGPLWSLGGGRGWDVMCDLPISAAAVGNHEFDEGVPQLLSRAGNLAFPLLCADLDVGLPAVAMIETEGGRIGVIGLTHPAIDRLADAPPSRRDPALVKTLAAQLRAEAADWIVILQHDGVTWWPDGRGTLVRDHRLRAICDGWGTPVDAVLGGHTLIAWSGAIGSTVAAQADAFATSVAVIDLTREGARVAGFAEVPSTQPRSEFRSVAGARLLEAENHIVGELDRALISRPTADRSTYLPDSVAGAIRVAGQADAAMLFSSALFTQPPVDGSSSYLRAGAVSRLDVHRLFPFPDDEFCVIELEQGEFAALVKRHDQYAEPANANADDDWWNWNRTPCGVATKKEEPRSVAVQTYTLDLIAEWLTRVPSTLHTVKARAAFEAAVAG